MNKQLPNGCILIRMGLILVLSFDYLTEGIQVDHIPN